MLLKCHTLHIILLHCHKNICHNICSGEVILEMLYVKGEGESLGGRLVSNLGPIDFAMYFKDLIPALISANILS